MANTHSTLASLFTDIAKAIRSKTGSSAAIVADQFPDAIAAIDTQENLDSELSTQDSLIAQINTALVGKAGVTLPALSNPAGAGNIEAGYQAIDGAGGLIEGIGNFVAPVVGTFKTTNNVSGSLKTQAKTAVTFNGEAVQTGDFFCFFTDDSRKFVYVGETYVNFVGDGQQSVYFGGNTEYTATRYRLGGAR